MGWGMKGSIQIVCQMTKMAAMSIYDKNLKKSFSLESKGR